MKAKLAYMASALAMASQGIDVRDLTIPHYEKPKPRKCDQKKCKSCLYCVKGKQNKRVCTKRIGCPTVDPLQIACEEHKKRK